MAAGVLDGYVRIDDDAGVLKLWLADGLGLDWGFQYNSSSNALDCGTAQGATLTDPLIPIASASADRPAG